MCGLAGRASGSSVILHAKTTYTDRAHTCSAKLKITGSDENARGRAILHVDVCSTSKVVMQDDFFDNE